MLPLEIFTLVLLASATVAIPQLQKHGFPNTTITTPPRSTTDNPMWAHDESTETGFEPQPTRPFSRSGSRNPIIESSETGWETIDEPPKTPPHLPDIPEPTPTDIVITTETPIIVSIHTDVSPPQPNPGPGQPSPGGNNNGPGGGNSASGNVPAVPQVTSGGDLLTDIISRIGAQPGAQPTYQPASPTEVGPPDGNQYTQLGGETEVPPGAQPTPAVGELITLGGSVLTLTPGLSTTLGGGTTATVVAITTDSSGQTIIVVSSSGTAVSATMTKTAVTLTAPRTGFDASATAVANPGENGQSSGGGAPTSTASAAGAADRRRREMEWCLGIVIGIGVLLR